MDRIKVAINDKTYTMPRGASVTLEEIAECFREQGACVSAVTKEEACERNRIIREKLKQDPSYDAVTDTVVHYRPKFDDNLNLVEEITVRMPLPPEDVEGFIEVAVEVRGKWTESK
jgi:hypothetical protein